jgi:hypothetical protein
VETPNISFSPSQKALHWICTAVDEGRSIVRDYILSEHKLWVIWYWLLSKASTTAMTSL